MWRSPIAGLVVALLLAACGQAGSPRVTHAAAPPTTVSTTPATVSTTTVPHKRSHRAHHHHSDPGRLPQTAQTPSAGSRIFHRQMAGLWRGITEDRLGPALPAFFPEAAYVQVKAIADPEGDWRTRLLGGFLADIQAAHALLGGAATSVRLIGVRIPGGYAHWVPPGTCANSVGYWETPNSRVVYRENGQVRSFGIASLISWRGIWYVVHLGAVLRSGSGGAVDAPSSGVGYVAPSATC